MSDNDKQAEMNEAEALDDEGQETEANESAEGTEDLHLLLEDARNKADEHWNELLRNRAEMENLRKRNARDVENAHKFGMEKFIQEILPVWDSLGRGLEAAQNDDVDVQSIREGMELTLKMMNASMEKFNLEEIDPQGDVFNPEIHQAMTMQETADFAPNTVMAVFQKGYLLNDRLIRPAMVVVAKASNAAKSNEYEKTDESGTKIDDQA